MRISIPAPLSDPINILELQWRETNLIWRSWQLSDLSTNQKSESSRWKVQILLSVSYNINIRVCLYTYYNRFINCFSFILYETKNNCFLSTIWVFHGDECSHLQLRIAKRWMEHLIVMWPTNFVVDYQWNAFRTKTIKLIMRNFNSSFVFQNTNSLVSEALTH